jgi:hypothetical protein
MRRHKMLARWGLYLICVTGSPEPRPTLARPNEGDAEGRVGQEDMPGGGGPHKACPDHPHIEVQSFSHAGYAQELC